MTIKLEDADKVFHLFRKGMVLTLSKNGTVTAPIQDGCIEYFCTDNAFVSKLSAMRMMATKSKTANPEEFTYSLEKDFRPLPL